MAKSFMSYPEKLDATNYPIWSMKMRSIMQQEDCFDVIENQALRSLALQDPEALANNRAMMTAQMPNATPQQVDAAQTAWLMNANAKTRKGYNLITLCVKDDILPNIAETQSSIEAWEILASIFQPKNLMNYLAVLKGLNVTVLHEGGQLRPYLTQMKALKAKFIAVGGAISE